MAASSSMLCSHCESGEIIVDPDTSTQVCSSCGVQISSDTFENQLFSSDGVRHYSLLPTSDPTYLQLKLHRAQTLISSLTSLLNLSAARSADVLSLVSLLTDGSFAVSPNFLSVLTAAASYVVARKHRIPLSLPEAADAAGCDSRQISRMLSRVLGFLDSGQLPDFDSASALSRTFRTHPKFSEIDPDKIEQMVGVGGFLISCAAKWFLSTGRRPMPLVAAVAAFVAEVDGVGVSVEEIAGAVHAGVTTTRVRLRELKEALVRVAKNLLPWGEDVDLKNLVQNAPLLIRFMQMRANSEPGDKTVASNLDFDLDGVFDMYSNSEAEGFDYFKVKVGGEVALEGMDWDELKNIKVSEASLSDAYKNVLERIDQLRESGGLRSNEVRKKKSRAEGFQADAWMDWDSDKNLSLEEVLERDVGYDALPPSFVNGIESRARRKEKIRAAKNRIKQTMNPRAKSDSGLGVVEVEGLSKSLGTRKRRKRKGGCVDGIDWEDCIIELLLLHRVDEEEIEQGQYNRLLELHVFNSLSSQR